MICRYGPALSAPLLVPSTVTVDPDLYGYAGCSCDAGYDMVSQTEPNGEPPKPTPLPLCHIPINMRATSQLHKALVVLACPSILYAARTGQTSGQSDACLGHPEQGYAALLVSRFKCHPAASRMAPFSSMMINLHGQKLQYRGFVVSLWPSGVAIRVNWQHC